MVHQDICDSDSPVSIRYVATCVCLTKTIRHRTSSTCACSHNPSANCLCHKLHNVSTTRRRSRFYTNLQYLFQATIVGVLSVTTMSAPLRSSFPNNQNIPSDQPKWVNPCGLPGHVFDPDRDMKNAPLIPIDDLYTNIYKTASFANSQTNKIKHEFVQKEFDDESFEEGVSSYRQDWLPEIPKATMDHFSTITREDALRESFKYLQYFAVGIEEILLDATLHDSSFRDSFKDIENYLTQLLCDVQMGMHVLGVRPSADVMRDVMSQEYRDMPDRTARLVRDYLILRDYARTVHYVAELFAYLKNQL